MEDSDIHLVFAHSSDKILDSRSVPASFTELHERKDKTKEKKIYKTREFCCWKVHGDSDDEDVYESPKVTQKTNFNM